MALGSLVSNGLNIQDAWQAHSKKVLWELKGGQ